MLSLRVKRKAIRVDIQFEDVHRCKSSSSLVPTVDPSSSSTSNRVVVCPVPSVLSLGARAPSTESGPSVSTPCLSRTFPSSKVKTLARDIVLAFLRAFEPGLRKWVRSGSATPSSRSTMAMSESESFSCVVGWVLGLEELFVI